MARYAMSAEGQAAQPAGAPVTTTFNGYFASIMAGASCGFKLRRLHIGVRAGTGVPTSMQCVVGLYRQTVACAGTGTTTVAGIALDTIGNQTSGITGLLITTAATSGTTGPTIGANALQRYTFNTQAGYDIPYEFLEELTVGIGAANGLGLVNLDNALPASHLYVIDAEWEE